MTGLPDDLVHRLRDRIEEGRWSSIDLPRRPATRAEVAASEHELGFALPPDLVDFYQSVANGGAGFLGLVNGAFDDRGQNAVTLYASFLIPDDDPNAPELWEWDARVLPIYSWGCNTYSCVGPDGRMIGRDGFAWVADGRTFVEWLDDWARGTPGQPQRSY